MIPWYIWIGLLVLMQVNVASSNDRWCPQDQYPYIRQMRKSNVRTAILAHIFGTMDIPSDGGYVPESWPSDDQISRQLFHHLGVMGMDHVHFTVLYNTTKPPSVVDIYPNASSCVRQWYNLGVFTWETVQYAGYSHEVHAQTFNEAYGRIRAEYDWIAILDIDELLVPTAWNPTNPSWCNHERPTIMELALQQMLNAATLKSLQSFALMEEFRHFHVSSADACPLGSAISHDEETKARGCTPIGYITLPGYYWETPDVNVLPARRCRFAGAYGYTNDTIMTREEDNQGQTWKSMHNTHVTTELSGHLTMHLGVGFSILAPRTFHKSGVSLEVAHLRVAPGRDNFMMGDSKLVKLFGAYESCMQVLGSRDKSANGGDDAAVGDSTKKIIISNSETISRSDVKTETAEKNYKKLQSLKKQLQYLRKRMDEIA